MAIVYIVRSNKVVFSMPDFIFLHSIAVRSGTNFLARIFHQHPDVEVIPRGETTQEFPLLKSIQYFEEAFNKFQANYNGSKNDYAWIAFKAYLGKAFQNYITDQLNKDVDKTHLFIKDPHIENIENFFHVFPDAKLILLLRDGRDLVASGEKGYIAERSSQSNFEKYKRKINHRLGRPFIQYTRVWKKKIDEYFKFMSNLEEVYRERVYTVKYESLAEGDVDILKELLAFCELSNATAENMLQNTKVIGSSFSNEINKNSKGIIWQPMEKTTAFKPVKRYENWPNWKKRFFLKVAGKELKALGYLND